MTYQQAAQQALDIQDACNLSGVVYAFARAMEAICAESTRLGKGTDWRNRNPIVTMHLLKLSELNGCGSTLSESYDAAERECTQIAAGRTEDAEGGTIVRIIEKQLSEIAAANAAEKETV